MALFDDGAFYLLCFMDFAAILIEHFAVVSLLFLFWMSQGVGVSAVSLGYIFHRLVVTFCRTYFKYNLNILNR